VALPGVEVVGDGDGTAGAASAADRDILVEGAGTLDGWLVGARVLPDGVGAAVTGDSTLLRARLRESDRILNHVVFY